MGTFCLIFQWGRSPEIEIKSRKTSQRSAVTIFRRSWSFAAEPSAVNYRLGYVNSVFLDKVMDPSSPTPVCINHRREYSNESANTKGGSSWCVGTYQISPATPLRTSNGWKQS
ncbi:unnamed protein product [Gulo gulo]|uniref:Uncharacterized protein n=1 Tax=Gulo gulo TaxID=48420 RepID=A0A9X9Q0R5_GULGU|nr:unnamed protein product [Gulo gulo]